MLLLPDRPPLGLHNPRVKQIARLLRDRDARRAERVLVAEGPRVVTAALDAGADVREVYVSGDGAVGSAIGQRAERAGVTVYELGDAAMARLSDTVTAQGVVAVVGFVPAPLEILTTTDLVAVLVDVRDPGNAGTLLRSAEGASAGAVVFSGGSVDVTSPKTVRASAGAVFTVPVVVETQPEEVLAVSARVGQQRLGTTSHGGRPYETVDMTRPTAFVFGNEAHGLPPSVTGHVDDAVTITLGGRAESLNVGMAATVLLFEARRQRRAKTSEHL